MELSMRNNLLKLFDVGRFHIEHIVNSGIVFYIPYVNAQVVRGKKLLSIVAKRQRVDVVLVAVAVKAPLAAFPAFIYYFPSWYHKLTFL